jgi:NAD(P) transhydrogenase
MLRRSRELASASKPHSVTVRSMELDLLVIGSGPSGQKAAIQAAKLGKRVAVAERKERLGGVSIHTGTIPSKTLREAVLEQLAQRPLDVLDPTRIEESEAAVLQQLMDRTARVVAAETAVVREQFRRNRVGLLPGQAYFVDANTVKMEGDDEPIRAHRIVIASGTNPARPPSVSFDDRTVIDSDGLLKLEHHVPRSMIVVGAGVIGVEYASMFGALGTKVTVIDKRDRVLNFLDAEIGEAFQYLLRRSNVTFRLRESVAAVDIDADARGPRELLESGKELVAETVLYAVGRQGDTAKLQLDKAGLEADSRGRIPVDETHRTAVPHIFAVGDVAGGGLAATAMEQGRIATLHAFGESVQTLPDLVPTGVYAIPEIAMVGRTEEQLTDEAVPYVTGVARWSELARGLMSGDEDGMLKLLVSTEERCVLGVHVIGTGATDLVHIGQAVMGGASTIDFLVTAVFNYPTFAESYKVAALDAANRIRG